MLNTTKFTLFATELLEDYDLEVSTNDGMLICNTKTDADADAAQLTQAVFSHERVSIGVSRKNYDWALGGMEIVKDADSDEALMYIENHSKQLRPISLIADQIEIGTFA